MTFSEHAASKFVPLLARIVLCIAFFPQGWNKVMDTEEFTDADADRLIELEVIDQTEVMGRDFTPVSYITILDAPAPPPPAPPAQDPEPDDPEQEEPEPSEPSAGERIERGAEQAGEKLEQGARKAGDAIKRAAEETGDAVEGTIQNLPKVPKDTAEMAPGGGVVVHAKKLHNITLMLDKQGIGDYAVMLAWIAAITELVGGGLILLGLFTRLWALGLAFTMVVAFYMTSLQPVLDTLIFDMDIPTYNTLIAQLGLFTLAFGVFLTGPGPVSLDRLLFGRRGASTHQSNNRARNDNGGENRGGRPL